MQSSIISQPQDQLRFTCHFLNKYACLHATTRLNKHKYIKTNLRTFNNVIGSNVKKSMFAPADQVG